MRANLQLYSKNINLYVDQDIGRSSHEQDSKWMKAPKPISKKYNKMSNSLNLKNYQKI